MIDEAVQLVEEGFNCIRLVYASTQATCCRTKLAASAFHLSAASNSTLPQDGTNDAEKIFERTYSGEYVCTTNATSAT